MIKNTLVVAIVLLAGLALASEARAQDQEAFPGQSRPLITEDVEIVRPGTVRFEAGIAFLQDQDFALSGLNGDLTRIGDIGFRIGVSPNVEVELQGTVQQFLSINSAFRPSAVVLDLGAKASDTKDVGDFTLATKIKINKEGKRLPTFGIRFGFQMPNTNQTKGIGTNSTNVFAEVLTAKTLGKTRLFGSLGLAILESPDQKFSQNDVLLYGVAFRHPLTDRVRLVGEINGRYSSRRPPVGTEDRSEARIGLQVDAAGLHFDAAGTFGLTRWSPRTGVVFGVTYDIKDTFEPVLK